MEKKLFYKIFENFKKQRATSVAHDGERVNIDLLNIICVDSSILIKTT